MTRFERQSRRVVIVLVISPANSPVGSPVVDFVPRVLFVSRSHHTGLRLNGR